MKNSIVNLAFAASLAAAQPHGHGHGHLHQKKGSPVQERDVYTTVVPVTETAYLLGTQTIDASEAQAGIAKSIYIVVGESTPTYIPSSATTSSSVKVEAQFYEKSTSTTSTSTSTSSTVISTSSSAVPTTSSVATTTTSSVATATTSEASSTTGATGIDADFPSGKIDCSTFPSAYGAEAVSYLDMGGWSGIQQVPDYDDGIDSLISYIVTAISGESCTEKSFCSYNCPAGYVKSQWPTAQGSTGQSIGGLYCNSDGKLELVRSSYKTLCQKGCGGVTIQNKMSSGVSVCRTDYPGTESMVLPLWVDGGETATLANIASADYYTWEGSSTTLQYYVNNKGVEPDEACVWTSSSYPTSAGNWAPVNIGVGKSSDGLTYMSIFPNTPTSTAELDFDVVISGDISGSCALKSGTYTDGSTTGCTVTISDGGSAVITFQDSS